MSKDIIMYEFKSGPPIRGSNFRKILHNLNSSIISRVRGILASQNSFKSQYGEIFNIDKLLRPSLCI